MVYLEMKCTSMKWEQLIPLWILQALQYAMMIFVIDMI